MSATWHPISAVFVPDPPVLATRRVLEMLLRGAPQAELLYAGDRMHPAVRHGSRVRVERRSAADLRVGDVVLTAAGPPDLGRVERRDDGAILVGADADPAPSLRVAEADVLGVARVAGGAPRVRARAWRRVLLDVREAWTGRPDAGGDDAATVRSKFAAQSAFYAASADVALPETLRARVREVVSPGGRIVVAGSGSGREAVALARDGFRVRGVDFATEMVAQARALARRSGVDAEFVQADLRRHREEDGTVDAVFFTYDVYSFLPGREDRIGTLRRMRAWLRPGGVVFLSARRLRTVRDAAMLALGWAARGGKAPFGDSHTRWIAADGSLRRSFVHVFPAASLAREVEAAGFLRARWDSGHAETRPARESR